MLNNIKSTKNVMNYRTIFAVGNLIKDHCRVVDQQGVQYEDGWDDERIAKESGATVLNVKGLREKILGKLYKAPTRDSLEARITALEAWAGLRPESPFERSNP